MKVWWLAVLTVAVFGASPDDACRFIGFRFARVISACEAGTCTNIHLAPDGSFHASEDGAGEVACDTALAALREILHLQVRPVRDSNPGRFHEHGDGPGYVARIHARVLPALQQLVYIGNVSIADADAAFRDCVDYSLALAARDWNRWHTLTVPYLLSSEVVVFLRAAATSILADWMMRSYLDQRGVVSALQFVLDLAALLPAEALPMQVVRGACLAVAEERPDARIRLDEPAGVVWAFEYLAAVGMRSEARSPGELLANILIHCGRNPALSTHALLLHHIRGWCPELTSVLGSLHSETVNAITFIKLGFSLVDLCRGVVDLDPLISARRFITSAVSMGPLVAPPPAGGVIPWLSNTDFSSELDAGSPGERVVQARAILAEALASGTVRPDRFTGRLFGRLLGVAIINGADAMSLGLSKSVASMLHPRMRSGITSLEELEAAVSELGESPLPGLLRVAAGIRDALGPGGPEMFTNEQWLARFGF